MLAPTRLDTSPTVIFIGLLLGFHKMAGFDFESRWGRYS
jgi:hypothetical protein